MKILITGGSGFVGTHLGAFLLDGGHRVISVGTSPAHGSGVHDRLRYLAADTTRRGPWQEALKEVDAVVNLAGRTIFQYWTKRHKARMYDSRILTTRNLVAALPRERAITLVSTSAAGYYGNRGDAVLGEDAAPGDDFLARICIDWENEALKARDRGSRVILARLGVVLEKKGGALAKMLPAFQLFAGGPLASGTQWFPWIHMHDLVSAILFSLENPRVSGPANFCAPGAVRHREFAVALGRVLRRPSRMPTPSFLIRTFMGEMGTSLLNSQRTTPTKLAAHGFSFRYPYIDKALGDLLG